MGFRFERTRKGQYLRLNPLLIWLQLEPVAGAFFPRNDFSTAVIP